MWSYLDVMDKNLLYSYAQVISGKKSYIRPASTDYLTEAERQRSMEEQRKQAYYLIWFVYRYVLNCKTLKEAMLYAEETTLKKYRLHSYVVHSVIYIGIDKDICFRKTEDIAIILEILYNRYNFFEQFDCFIKNTSNIRRKRCEQVLENYKKMLDGRIV